MNISINKYSGIYCLTSVQLLKTTIDEAWQFFSTPVNLEAITPTDMSFHITSGTEGLVYPGKIITYRLQIFPVVKTNWITEITVAKKNECFIDEQRVGPYALWHHEHKFEQTEDGVLMTDKVTYKLPMGILGNLFAGNFVKQKLMKVFSYRYQYLEKKFNRGL